MKKLLLAVLIVSLFLVGDAYPPPGGGLSVPTPTPAVKSPPAPKILLSGATMEYGECWPSGQEVFMYCPYPFPCYDDPENWMGEISYYKRYDLYYTHVAPLIYIGNDPVRNAGVWRAIITPSHYMSYDPWNYWNYFEVWDGYLWEFPGPPQEHVSATNDLPWAVCGSLCLMPILR